MTKREWIIRLMQGMVGSYGHRGIPNECWYDGEAFKIKREDGISDLDINWINPEHNFYIDDKKGIPMEDITICNITN